MDFEHFEDARAILLIGLSRVLSNADEGVCATCSRLWVVSWVRSMKSSLTIPRTPLMAP